MKETMLFEPVKQFLISKGCSDVFAEVGTFDVLGIHGSVDILVEMKTTLNFKVIDQALSATTYGHYVYIAVPKRKGEIPVSVRQILTTNRIGLLYVEDEKVKVMIPAKYNRVIMKRKSGFRLRNLIKSFQHELVGGAKSGDQKTEYSNTMDAVRSFLKYPRRGEWTTIDEILEVCETHYSNPKPSLSATLRKPWNADWIETRKNGRKLEFRYKKQASQ